MGWNYLRMFCDVLKNTEVPPRFALWSGIGSLLAALERRVYVEQGIYRIYPNFFIVLVAASGQKKSTAIGMADRLVRRLGTVNVVAQKVTPESLIASIGVPQRSPDGHMVPLKKHCGGVIIADELVTFLDKNALEKGLGPILTKLYDCTPFNYYTLKRGEENVIDGYLSILGGTTIELIRNALPKDSIGGGFTSRTIFVYEDRVQPPVPWIEIDDDQKRMENNLLEYLKQLKELQGPITLDKEAREYYEKVYRDRYYHSPLRNNPITSSYESRRHCHFLKVAIAFMLSEGPSRTLSYRHLEQATLALEDVEQHVPKVLSMIAATESGALSNSVYHFIRSRPNGATRSEIASHFMSQMDSKDLGKVLDTLVVARRVSISTNQNQVLIYKAEEIY